MFIGTILVSLWLLAIRLCWAGQSSSTTPSKYPITPIYEFPNGTNLENLVVRSDGIVLLTSSGLPQFWAVDPANNKTATNITPIPHVNSLQGMVLLDDETVAILAGNHTSAPDYDGTKGSWAVWILRLCGKPGAGFKATAEKIVDIPEARLLDGFAGIDGTATSTVNNQGKTNLVITGDALGNTLYTIDLSRRTATLILKNTLLEGKNTTVGAGGDEIGINGLKYANGTAFWDDSSKQLLNSLPVDPRTGAATGPPQTIQVFDTFIDDFQILPGGRGFLIDAEGKGLLFASPKSNTSTVIADIPAANACVWGQTSKTRCTLYVTYQGLNVSGLVSLNMTGSGFLPEC